MKLVFSSTLLSQIWWYPEKQSRSEKRLHPAALSMEASILGSGNWSFLQALFRSVKSMHILIFPFVFGTNTTFASHYEYLTSLITFASSNLWTSAFTAIILSSNIFLCHCFLGLTFRFKSNECWIMYLLTPCGSEADQAKTSLFLARVSISSASSSFESFP